MEIFLPEPSQNLQDKLTGRINQPDNTGVLCPDTMREMRQNLRQKLLPDLPESTPLILTGHQPIFYHPGILIKDMLAHRLACIYRAQAVNLIVDTDEAVISFDYPVASPENTGGEGALKDRFALNRPGEILKFQRLEDPIRRAFVQILHGYKPQITRVFKPGQTRDLLMALENLCDIVSAAESVMEPGIRMRESWEREKGLNLKGIYAGDIADSDAFAFFVEIIIERGDEFRKLYNEALNEYRRIHKIKNAAQPLPNLDTVKKELPFWIIKEGKRLPFHEGMDYRSHTIYPRAVSLTMFSRLFLCDLLIHGRGGARYEQITDHLLEKFFKCPGAPYSVASATLALNPQDKYPMNSRSREEIIADIRAVEYDPTRFLPREHELHLEKMDLVKTLQAPEADRREIHLKILEINKKTRAALGNIKTKLEQEKAMVRIVNHNRDVFLDRTFPFIFYNVEPLMAAVERYTASIYHDAPG